MSNSRPQRTQRINYSILNSTGVKSFNPQPRPPEVDSHTYDSHINEPDDLDISSRLDQLTLNDMPTPSTQLMIETNLVIDEIADLIDENPVHPDYASNFDNIINKLGDLRKNLRRSDHLIKADQPDHPILTSITQTLNDVKDYIKSTKDCKVKCELAQAKQISDTANQKERSTVFAMEDIKYTISELQKDFDKSLDALSDAELIQIKSDMPARNDQISKISKKYERILQAPCQNAEMLMNVREIGNLYEHLLRTKSIFQDKLNAAIIKQDVYKQKLFSESKLNIRLDKFSGQGDIDFYSFKSDFNKLHERTTPKHLLPDLLKNNYLIEPALSLVKSIKDIDLIWDQLKFAYGDVKMLLSRKLKQVSSMDSLSRTKDASTLAHSLSKIITLLNELIQLAEKHNIEHNLYYSDGLHRVYNLLDDARLSRWLRNIADDEAPPKATWLKLVKFLETEQKLQQQKMVIIETTRERPSKPTNTHKQSEPPKGTKSRHSHTYNGTSYISPLCFICNSQDGENDHFATSGPAGSKIIQYHTCLKFVELSPANRFNTLKDKGYCFQCLYPGANGSTGKHKDGKCQRDFVCPHPSHQKYPVRKHILVCEEHKESAENKNLLDTYKQRYMKSSHLPTFSRNISLSFHSGNCYKSRARKLLDEPKSTDEQGIYLLQKITINNNCFTIFFDNGCSDFLIKQSAVKMLGDQARKESSHVTHIGGVGNTSTCSTLGSYNVRIPMVNGQFASLSGTCIEEITTTFPHYPLTEVYQSICKQFDGDTKTLPIPSTTVGGDVHLMLGIKYLRYHPTMIFQLPSGLAIYKSVFRNADGGLGVIGGPHPIFTAIQNKFFHSHSTMKSFCSQQYQIYKMGLQVNPDVSMLALPSKNLKQFEAAESTGSEITYRCVSCRGCKECKNSIHQQEISIKEEIEQDVINKSVQIDLQNQTITASLPFVNQPSKLTPNKNIALKIFYQQLKKLNSNPRDKADIIASEAKLQQLGYVDYVENLSSEQQLMLKNSPHQNYIPWRAVWKCSSISTPCRIVYDASHATASGYSLNDLLAKGQNQLNKLQEILIRWYIHKIAIHTDIRKMYNTIRLDENHWCFQRYVWQQELDASKIPKEKIIKTLIYGVRSSGNQAEHGLRATAITHKEEFPEVNQIIQEDVYVDDVLTGEDTTDIAHTRADELEVVVNRGGFNLKGITFSGSDPLPDLTEDGESISVGGMKWFPKSDELSLSIGDLNFSKKQRGKKSANKVNIIPEKLTRRHCASKVAEIFDLTGKMTPIVAAMKLDLQELSLRQLSWDDMIPDELRSIWINHFKTMKELGELRFKRAVVPDDAINLDIETLEFGDASKSLVCVCIYVRFRRRNGQHSCQLIFGRTRTVPKDLSLPRAELMAALINTHSGEVVRRSLGRFHKSSMKFTDSQIALHWITNDEKPLKQWVRNRVIEINRFTSKDEWFYVKTTDMIADIGTRHGATLKDVQQDSPWMSGYPWMHRPISEFPIQTAQDLRLSETDVSEVEKERTILLHHTKTEPIQHNQMEEVGKRYKFSRYLIDPNRHRFSVIVRIMAYVIRFCKNLIRTSKKIPSVKPTNSRLLSDEEINVAEKYFFKKTTQELIHFLPKSKYQKITKEVDGIMMYVGRILPDNQVSIVGRFTNTMKDLSSDSFFVPVIDRSSPVAYSIALEFHWYHPTIQHCGIETTLRYILKKCHIIEGRILVKQIKKSCHRCRYLEKRTVDMAMGPISRCNMTIAPSFYHTQMDLSGPYQSFSPQHKRTTVKIWLIVYCCCSTTATKIYVMDDYSTTSFILAITRFATNHGFPNQLLCDEGSQLIKGCKEMKVNILDLQQKLHKDVKVNFQVCPVQGHNMNGKVERKIKEINSSLQKTVNNQRLSILQWETLGSAIANQINNLPLAVGDVTGDFECIDLITPNRLMLGRNNDRSIDGLIQCDNPSKVIKENEKVFDAWFEVWLLVHVPKLMKQQKWFDSDMISVGDVILFTKVDSLIESRYVYGMVTELEYGQDSLPRKAKIRYRNANENVCRETYRSVRGLVRIVGVDESDLLNELGTVAKNIDIKSSV